MPYETLIEEKKSAPPLIVQAEEKYDNKGFNRKLLWSILKETQCPLAPEKYGKDAELSSAYYFDGEFWTFNAESDSLEMVDFNNDDKRKRQAMDDSELMLAVDKYVSNVHINNSIQVFNKLKTALAETQGDDDGDDSNDAYKKLMPTMTGLILFVFYFFVFS